MNILRYVYAAADADILNMATTTVETLKDNIVGVMVAILPTLAIIFGLFIVVAIVFKIVRRVSK